MRLTIASLTLSFVTHMFAQITITSMDLPSVDDILEREFTTIPDFDPGDTGADHVWDFSSLSFVQPLADTAIAISETPFPFQFFFNNPFLYPEYVADYAIPGQDFSVQVLSVSDSYEYFKVDADAFQNVGFGANINGLPSSIRRDPIDRVYELPMNYEDSYEGFSSFEIAIPSLLYFQEEQTRSVSVDGWGSLILPDGQSYEVLRVRSILNRTDTIFLETLGFGLQLPLPETIEYKWLANGEPEPLLSVTTTGGVVGAASYRSQSVTSLSQNDKKTWVLFPNPADGWLNIMTDPEEERVFQLIDIQGRVLATERFAGRFEWDIRSMPNGLYIIETEGWQQQFIIDR